MTRIEFDDVTVRAVTADGDRTLLAGVSAVLTESRVALIGPNGSGKSTLARLVNGLVEPAEGRVRVDGIDVTEHAAQVRRRVGFVFSDPAAQLVMPTAAEDVALSLRTRHRSSKDRRAAALAVLESYGLTEVADRSVHSLSGGQRQLLALAGVLATDPSVLVADEPTTLLDLRNSRRIGQLLFGLPQQLLLVTHDLELAAQCDRALLVEDGRVVADGPADSVVDHYRALA
ncbi:energy-coupling factor ABC transporter ATP-binding protein [Nakamurella leprariae]|uniref:energy-coupling factor ABC transporter ATP-binding protein n=1 Tax=Nakamurella leprariae TaxID=2803911 RepID=UPI002E2C69B8|nr:ABC transporter ATP-binding protein [Nakamurella leprariae]